MRKLVFVLVLSWPGTGCSMMTNGVRNLVVEPIRCVDDCKLEHRCESLAREAWLHLVEAGADYSAHYARGFKKGFADFLYSGGNGEPPMAPPWPYQTIVFQTPRGNQAILDWYAGFRHGSFLARETGMRQYIVIPLSAPYEAASSTSQAWAGDRSGPADPGLPMPRNRMPRADEEAVPAEAAPPRPVGAVWRFSKPPGTPGRPIEMSGGHGRP